MFFKKTAIALFLIASLALVFGGVVVAQEEVELNILALKMDSTQYIDEKTNEWIEQYEKEHDVEVSVNWEYLAEEDARAHAVEDMATGTGYYQIAQVGTQHITLMAANDWLVPVEDYFTEDYRADEFVEAVETGASYDGKMYGVPIYHEATHLFYRHDVFEELGIEPPETLAGMKEKAKMITEETEMAGVVLRGRRGAGLNHVSWKQFLHAYGGKWLKDFERPYEPAFNSEEGIKATKWYAEMIRNYAPEGSQTAHWREAQAMFMSGEAAMMIDATSISRRVLTDESSQVKGDVSFKLIPKGPEGRYPWYFSWNLGISKPGTEGLTREVAADYVMWATSPEMKIDMMEDLGVLPARETTLNSDKAEEVYGDPNMSNWLSNTIKSLNIEEAAENPVIAKVPEWPAIGDTIGIQLEEIFTGSKTVEEGLSEAAKTIEQDF